MDGGDAARGGERRLVVPAAPVGGELAPRLAEAIEAAKAYARRALAPETLRAYRTDLADFEAWCLAHRTAPLPAAPGTVAAYLAALAPTHSRSALDRRLAAIGHAHRVRGLDWTPGHPAIRTTLQGIARLHGSRVRQAAALTSAELRRLVATCDAGLTGCRDRALLLLGFAGALRRSELVGVDREHLRLSGEGLRLLLPRSKTDQAGEGVELGIPRGRKRETCPVRAVEAWIEAGDVRFGPLFTRIDRWGRLGHDRLSPDGVRQILLRRAAVAKVTVDAGERLSPHGLRAGFVTEAYGAGARDEEVMGHSRHKDLRTMRGYVRRAKLVTTSPVKLLDL
ncbi:tyrosine-type recombinase/integrase [Muricoccus radiodurans]|uniref:tyrosine-type recombinase/integrase n=1 Tax=Muricoccus radiodurans TaxID=2231721 RepID=UPI003CEC2EE8